jgi:hypothetical protein
LNAQGSREDRAEGQRVRAARFREAGNALAGRKLIIEDIPAAAMK